MNNSNFTGRTSRTMNEAFGAHCATEITEPPVLRWSSIALGVVYVIAVIVWVVVL
jgi:hypothetical protein